MKKYLKPSSLLLALAMMLSLAGCGKSDEPAKSDGSESKGDPGKNQTVSEEYFQWEVRDPLICGLSESGAKQEELVIPKRCEGFNGAPFAGEEVQVKSVSFESDADIDLNGGLSCSDSLEYIKLPSGLTKIGEMEFWSSHALKEITIPASVKELGKYAFQADSKLEKVVIEADIPAINPHTFDNCTSLTEINLPDSITLIDEYAFFQCASLKEVTLPAGLKEIRGFAFANSGLEKVIVPAEVTLEKYDTTSFAQADHDVNIYVTEGSWMDQNFESVFDGAFNKLYSE